MVERSHPMQRKSASKRPWPLIKNGDLWQSIEEVVVAKGPKSVKVSKAKGHATGEMVQEAL